MVHKEVDFQRGGLKNTHIQPLKIYKNNISIVSTQYNNFETASTFTLCKQFWNLQPWNRFFFFFTYNL